MRSVDMAGSDLPFSNEFQVDLLLRVMVLRVGAMPHLGNFEGIGGFSVGVSPRLLPALIEPYSS
ncbi:MAG: hypothetical protein PVJ76_19305, partial [Gemmatimonadota bacterium]